MLFIYTTCASKKEAQKIASALLHARLVVCANFWSIESLYLWRGKLTRDKEVALLLKTHEKYFSKVERAIKKMHSYDLPCIVAWKIGKVNQGYLKWMQSEIE